VLDGGMGAAVGEAWMLGADEVGGDVHHLTIIQVLEQEAKKPVGERVNVGRGDD